MYRLVLILLPHSLKSKVRQASYWIGRWGRPCGVRTSDHAIAPSNGSRHYGGPYTTGRGGGGNMQSGPEGQVFPGIVTLPPPPSTNVLQKPVTIPRNTLIDLNGNLHAQRTTDKRTKNYKPGTQPNIRNSQKNLV